MAVGIIILILLFRNVNLNEAYDLLSKINLPLLASSIIFFILSSLAMGFALQGALRATNAAPPISTTQLANFGGQLLSDVTPAKSGYFATPVLLNQLNNVPIEKGLISVMSVGALNFFVKAGFSIIALFYFIDRISINPAMTYALLVGIALLLAGGTALAILVWTNHLSNLFKKLNNLPLLGRVVKRLDSIRILFANDQTALRKSTKTIVTSIVASIIFSGISLYLVANALNLNQPAFQDLFFMGPLTAVFMYVPVTFAGLGLQEAAYAFLLTSIGAPIESALTFALIVRLIATATDLIGLPPLLTAGTRLLYNFKEENNSARNPQQGDSQKSTSEAN